MTDLPTHEAAADTEARHAHREALAEKDAEIERLSEILTGIEMLTATGGGLDAEQTICIHLIAAEGRADDHAAWRADPAVIERLRAAVRGETARDAEIERLKREAEISAQSLRNVQSVREHEHKRAEAALAEIERLTALLEERSISAFEFLTEGDAKEILRTLSKAQCLPCLGTGERNDAAAGDISFNSWVCPDCEGKGWNKQAVHEIIAAHQGNKR